MALVAASASRTDEVSTSAISFAVRGSWSAIRCSIAGVVLAPHPRLVQSNDGPRAVHRCGWGTLPTPLSSAANSVPRQHRARGAEEQTSAAKRTASSKAGRATPRTVGSLWPLLPLPLSL
jgi:hypothetical protein